MDYPTQKADDGENAIIESYLDELCAPLRDLPQDAQDEIRREIGAHLRSLVAMQREPQRVLASALQQFGDPAEIGRLMALEWENREWDLSGLSLLARLQKIRQALAQEDRQNAMLKKRSYWLAPLFMAPFLLHLLKSDLPTKNLGLVRALDVALFLACGLAFVVSLAFAWLDWHNARMREKSKISRVQMALSQVAAGLVCLTPLTFGRSVLPGAFSAYVGFAAAAMVVLIAVLGAFEPSRKRKLVSRTSMSWGFISGLCVFLGIFALSALGIASVWIQIPLLCLVMFALRRWFFKGAQRKRDKRQNVE